ncbi:hypothetical protein GF336_06260 [Candidatus Woesearchaeota archaeon]|nr:hypothetical protein [Candidatus Woesearchaeota archaeon]
MEIDIKCAACGKRTLNVNIGEVIYDIENPSKTIMIKNSLICPKCKKDINNKECLIRSHDILMGFIAANICMDEGDVPPHLDGTFPLKKKDYDIIKKNFKTRPKLVKKF